MNRPLARVVPGLLALALSGTALGTTTLEISEQTDGLLVSTNGVTLTDFVVPTDYPLGSAQQTHLTLTLIDDADGSTTTLSFSLHVR